MDNRTEDNKSPLSDVSYTQSTEQKTEPVYTQSVPTTHVKKSSSGSKMFLFGFLGAALACVIAFFGLGVYAGIGGGGQDSSLGSGLSTQIIDVGDDETLAEVVADKALPSIASIDVYSTPTQAFSIFGYGSTSNSNSTDLVQSSLGSGVVLSEDGYIITNNHVIEGAEKLYVTVEDEQYEAKVVGTDPSSDLAVIKAENASGLTPIEVGSSSDLKVGQWVMTLGSPFGYEQSVATGIVSAVSRSQIVESTDGSSASVYANMIQTDAAINPGNSGGALVDANGRLIGINTLISSSSGNYSGVGFAIPVDYAVSIAQQIIDGKKPSHAQLGVSLRPVTKDLAERYGLAIDTGAYVTYVHTGSSAANAGLEVGDIITKLGDTSIESASDLMIAIRSHNPGDKVTVEFNRDGDVQTTEATLGSDATD